MSYFSRFVSLASSSVFVGALFLGLGTLSSTSARAQEADSVKVEVNLEQYVGSYGPRIINLVNNRLTFMRDGMPVPVSMSWLGQDHFKIDIPAGAQVRTPNGGPIPTIRFDRNVDGQIDGLSLMSPDGEVLGTSPRNVDG